MDRVQSILSRFVDSALVGQLPDGQKNVFAPHPDGHVGIFPTKDTKVGPVQSPRSTCTLEKAFRRRADPLADVDALVRSQISSIGIQIRRYLTSHGFALNITPSPLPWFDLITACGLPSISAVALASFPSTPPSATPTTPPPVERTYGAVTEALVPLIADRFGGQGVVELASVGGEVLRLVRELEDESAADGLEWRDVPRGQDQTAHTAKRERI